MPFNRLRFVRRPCFFSFQAPARSPTRKMKNKKAIKQAAQIKIFKKKTTGDSLRIIFQNTFQRKIESKSSFVISISWRRCLGIGFWSPSLLSKNLSPHFLPAADFLLIVCFSWLVKIGSFGCGGAVAPKKRSSAPSNGAGSGRAENRRLNQTRVI